MTTKKQPDIQKFEDSRELANAVLVLHQWASEQAAAGSEDGRFVFSQTARVYFSALRLK